MTRAISLTISLSAAIAMLVTAGSISAEDKDVVKVPGGLGFAEFKGYENWPVIAISANNGKIAAILGNPTMIEAYRKGVPQNGQAFPDGARMAKIHWLPKREDGYPGEPVVPGAMHDVDFMVKDSKRFARSGGWGWAAFQYDAASGAFRPSTMADSPPQAHDAKCGLACHTAVKARDYVFTEYGKR